MSFGNANAGVQLGINHGSIHLLPDRPENTQQRVDNEVLRSLAYPQMLDRRDDIEPCHTNTCQWILDLEKYQSWRSQSRGLLWIKGKPGAGKSTLMVFLHDRLRISQDDRQGIRLDFFFTARGTELQRTPLGMLRSLLNQIFVCDATIRPQVRDIYKQRCKQFGYGEGKWEWPRVVLEELLAGIILKSASRQHVTVFVDALDEAGTESAQQLAAYFHRLISRAEKANAAVQICISCRHYPIVESARAVAIYVEDHNHKDITMYIKDNLADMELGDSPSDKARGVLVEQLIQQAKGVFQWARLIIPLIRQKIFEGESFDDIRCWLREVPAELKDVYTYILNNVIEAKNREQSFLFFQWVCLAERPLTVTEMRYALAAKNAQITPSPKTWEKIDDFVESNERMKRRIKALSGGLAEVVSSGDNDESVQVVHQSVNDFLRVKGLGLLCHHIDAKMMPVDNDKVLFQCHATLYRSCLVYLATIHLPREILNHHQSTRKNIAQDRPLLTYSTKNLFIHAEKAAASRADVLQNERDILQRVVSRWVQIYQILNPYNTARPPKDTTIIHMAAAANLVDIIECLVFNGEDVMRKDGKGKTAFHLAARHGHIPAGEILRAKGADSEAKYENGTTPLIEAASFGQVGFVEWLLHKGVKLETTRDGSESALQAASLRGHQGIVELLLDAGADVNAQGGKYGNALQAAASSGKTEIVQKLLDTGADVNAQGGEYGNALQAAASSGKTEIVQKLLDTGADVNAQGGEYGNALQAAAATYFGRTEIVQKLLDARADVNAQGGKYGNALQAAASSGKTEIVQKLLDARADVNAQGGKYGNALQAAAATYFRRTEIVQMLLDAGADVNARSGEYGNALQAAASSGHTEIVQKLLDAGADVNAQGGEYGNALQAAASSGKTEIVQKLLDARADVNAQGGKYGNALQAAAATYFRRTEIVQMLLDAGADVNARSGEYGNALQAAASSGHTEIVQKLLDAGADVNAQGGEYGNALQAAASSGNTEIVQKLLDARADVNAQGGKYGNALQAAASSRHTEIVQKLLDAGADVNAQGGKYGNALQAAAPSGHTEIVQKLLDAGADVNAQGGGYGNALQAAAATYFRRTEIVQMLLDAGADVNAQGGKYGNALQAAASSGHTEIVQKLLDAGADVNAQGGEYGNALQAAAAAYFIRTEIVQMLLDAGADVNARSGRYGSPLLAAVYKGRADRVQMLLHAGADPLLADELDQTPLHIAAAKDMLNLVNRFPLLASAINNKDMFLQTPLHLALCLGRVKFAIKLLHLGANPSLLDGYGRNILDWVVGNEGLMHQIQSHWPSIVVTPDETQKLTVRQSILQISDTLLRFKLDSPWPLLEQLGRYCLFLDDTDNARYLFQLYPSQGTFFYADIHEIICDFCERAITGSRFSIAPKSKAQDL
ncbi:hypothetical protein N7537_011314 [Penicillium hordei]|uniref:Nephrocystin 3-like N-terminal domain-containing protein n=1 Tax=Penicillium hordei TaxID=40994 RepID=A0AAD6DLX4_9EURO|nr:uncharacterized protein N7537_011314 [Penicillium hordei]KAJ5588636.1 hypothetical protein N7537_011314 [Penicillium hordei]